MKMLSILWTFLLSLGRLFRIRRKDTSTINLTEYYGKHGAPQDIQLQHNAQETLKAVNAMILKYDLPYSGVVTSGYRPSAYNRKIGGSPKSAHIRCQAVDLLDNEKQELADSITPKMLREFGLYMEDQRYTGGARTRGSGSWVHLQIRPTKRRIFIPY